MAIRNRPPPKKSSGHGSHVKRTTPRKTLGSLKGGVKAGGVSGAKASKGAKTAKGTAQTAHAHEAHEAEEAHEVADVAAGGMEFDLDSRGGGGGSGFGKQNKESILGARKSATTAKGELRRAPDDGGGKPRALTGFETANKRDTPFGGKKADSGEKKPAGDGESATSTKAGADAPKVGGDKTSDVGPKPMSAEGRATTGAIKVGSAERPVTREGAALTTTGSAVGAAVAKSTGGQAVGDGGQHKPNTDGVGKPPPLAEQTLAPVGDKELAKATEGMKKSEVGREAVAVVKGDPLERTVTKAVDAQQESDIQDAVKEDTKGVALSGGRASSQPPFSDVPQGADDIEPMDIAEINAEARALEAKNGLPLVKAGDERKPSMNAPPEIQLAVTDMATVAGQADPSLGVKDIADSMKTGTDTDGEGEGEEEAEEEEEDAAG
jgi:hypothetical protein